MLQYTIWKLQLLDSPPPPWPKLLRTEVPMLFRPDLLISIIVLFVLLAIAIVGCIRANRSNQPKDGKRRSNPQTASKQRNAHGFHLSLLLFVVLLCVQVLGVVLLHWLLPDSALRLLFDIPVDVPGLYAVSPAGMKLLISIVRFGSNIAWLDLAVCFLLVVTIWVHDPFEKYFRQQILPALKKLAQDSTVTRG